jgi:hypothetical protein
VVLDVQGNILEVIDANDNTAEDRTFGCSGRCWRLAPRTPASGGR